MDKNIHFIWISRSSKAIPALCLGFIDAWRKLHPGYTIKIWGMQDITELNDIILNAMIADPCLDMAQISNYARLIIVERCGGLYADIDTKPIRSFHDLLATCRTMMFGLTMTCKCELNLFYADKGSQVLRLFIANFTSPRRANAYDWITPDIMALCTVLPPEAFHAYHITQKSYSIHWPHRLGSWFGVG